MFAADCGDNVVVTNSKYLLMTGKKTEDKVYYYHTGRPGHLKVTPLQRMIEKKVQNPYLESKNGKLIPGQGHWGDFKESSFRDASQEQTSTKTTRPTPSL
jgi:ribosomal protein L13